MGTADLHIHTIHSWDATMTPAGALKAAVLAGLDVIAVTDHNELRGAHKARELAGTYGIEVIAGCEISTAQGHLLALFVETPIRKHLPLIETLVRIGEQGGLAVVPHPGMRLTSSVQFGDLSAALLHPDARRVLAGLEVYNAGILYRFRNHLNRIMAAGLPLAQVGSSDAHVSWWIGRGFTKFPGRSTADLRQALIQRKTSAHGAPGVIAVSSLISWLWHIALRQAGWVTSNRQPGLPLVLERLAPAAAS